MQNAIRFEALIRRNWVKSQADAESASEPRIFRGFVRENQGQSFIHAKPSPDPDFGLS